VVSSVTIAERSSEVNALCGDILLIAVLPVEAESIFDGSKVTGFVVVSGGIFDVVKLLCDAINRLDVVSWDGHSMSQVS